jgi:hypothetical protein
MSPPSTTDLDTTHDAEIVYGTGILTEGEALEITSRIRVWVNACPIADIKRAFFGQAWKALGYESWSEWCDSELDGFRLPSVERREVVKELAKPLPDRRKMSNRQIAEVVGVGTRTVDRDVSGASNGAPDLEEGLRCFTWVMGVSWPYCYVASRPGPQAPWRRGPEAARQHCGGSVLCRAGRFLYDRVGGGLRPSHWPGQRTWEVGVWMSRVCSLLRWG